MVLTVMLWSAPPYGAQGARHACLREATAALRQNLAARWPHRGGHRRRLSGSTSPGLRRSGRHAVGFRSLGGSRRPVRLRADQLLATALGRTRVDDGGW